MSLCYQVDWNYSPLHRYTKSAYPSMPADASEPVVSATAVHLSVRQSLLMTLQWFFLHSERMDVVCGRYSHAENYISHRHMFVFGVLLWLTQSPFWETSFVMCKYLMYFLLYCLCWFECSVWDWLWWVEVCSHEELKQLSLVADVCMHLY